VRLGDGIPVALSPDGAWALSIVPTTPQKAMLLPTGPGQARTLDLGPIASLAPAGSWMPDGRHILVTGSRAGRLAGLWLLDAAGGPPQSVSPEGIMFGSRSNRRVSPDGRLVICGNAAVPAGLFDLRTQTLRPLPGQTSDLRFIGWTADGSGILAFHRRLNPSPVYRVDPATGSRRELFQIRRAPWEDLGSVRVSADLKSYAYTTSSQLDDLYLMRGLR
jgi:Tol biopolymer transport system component